MEWVESMGVVSRRWVWVESMGVVVRRYIYRFTPTTPLVSAFLQHPYLLFIKKNIFCSCYGPFL